MNKVILLLRTVETCCSPNWGKTWIICWVAGSWSWWLRWWARVSPAVWPLSRAPWGPGWSRGGLSIPWLVPGLSSDPASSKADVVVCVSPGPGDPEAGRAPHTLHWALEPSGSLQMSHGQLSFEKLSILSWQEQIIRSQHTNAGYFLEYLFWWNVVYSPRGLRSHGWLERLGCF